MGNKDEGIRNEEFQEIHAEGFKDVEDIEKEVEEKTNKRLEELDRKLGTGKQRKRRIAVIIVAVLFVFLIGYRIVDNFILDGDESVEQIVNVKTDVVKMGEIYLESPVTAKIQAHEEVAIVPLVAGKVTSVNVKVGDYVTQGTVLFTIDDTQMQSSLVQAREGYNLAKATYERMQILYNEGVISQQDFESARTQYITAEQGYNTAVESAAYYTVTTPISGYVTSMSVTVGGVAGQQMAASVADDSKLVIKNTVSESLAGKINVGDKVDVYVSSLDKIFEGTVTTASKIPSIGTVTYPIEIELSDPNDELMAGMFAEIRIKSEHMESALVVPSEAVIIKNGESVVVTLDGTMPVFNKVETGIDNGELVEIISGVKQGQTIVVSGQHYVVEGEEVRVVE
ncbi:MAG: efflux RND transporter periplasmic adaptor subunit [Firmicutes bacterium]|nr:efflux RND transporter periplasmic adaptor subunit [Clostridiales bacterium]MBQ4339998.1 efflux RND transporter periplasmic adaptor subunit [Bacillota bacterium]